MPCSPLKATQHFRETCCFHLQGRKICLARNQYESGCLTGPLVSWSSDSSTLKMDSVCSFEMLVTFSGLHGILFRKIELFQFLFPLLHLKWNDLGHICCVRSSLRSMNFSVRLLHSERSSL
jgi:hypothetical protein